MEAPFEKLVIKLWETIADKGIGSLLKPWQMRREGQAANDVKRAELLMLDEVQTQINRLKSSHSIHAIGRLPAPSTQLNNQLQIEYSDAKQRLESAEVIAMNNLKAEALRKEVALAKAVLHAEDELRDDPTSASDAEVADDWLLRWRDYASGVSSDELQAIWGKVLAGEVRSPGCYSLRTLEFLRNLSQTEALAIEKIAPYSALGRIFSFKQTEMIEVPGFTYDELLELQDLGIIHSLDNSNLISIFESNNSEKYRNQIFIDSKLFLIESEHPSRSLHLRTVPLTAIGKQILALIQCAPSLQMLESLANNIKAQGFNVQMGDYIKINELQVRPLNMVTV